MTTGTSVADLMRKQMSPAEACLIDARWKLLPGPEASAFQPRGRSSR